MITAVILFCLVFVALFAYTRFKSRTPALSAVERRLVEGEIELELSDGRLFRSERGFVWACFPSGARADVSLEGWLGDEARRLKRLDRWSADV